MTVIWVTRGRSWGHRILRGGSDAEALDTYETAFEDITAASNTVVQLPGGGVAVRLIDPLGRTDRSGRPILHDFIVTDADAARVTGDVDAGAELWKLVADEYDAIWADPLPPPVA